MVNVRASHICARAAPRAAGSAPRSAPRARRASPARMSAYSRSKMRGYSCERVWRRAEEREDLRVGLGRALGEVLGADDEQLVAREDVEPALELLGVEAAGDVGGSHQARLNARGSATSRSTSPRVRSSSAARASSNESGSRPSATSCWYCEYARATGSRRSATSFTCGTSERDAVGCERVEEVARARLADEPTR